MLLYQITNTSSTSFSDIPPGTSKLVESEKEVQVYQKFIDTGMLSIQRVDNNLLSNCKKKHSQKFKGTVSRMEETVSATSEMISDISEENSEEMEIKEHG